MGMILGKVSEEMPKHLVVYSSGANAFEVWRYTSSSVAAVVHAIDVKDPKTNEIPTDERFTSLAFPMLARYIGVFGTPQNEALEGSDGSNEKIAMTAPVVMDPPTEKIAMTAPVVMDPSKSDQDSTKNTAAGAAMKFLLPSKYQTVEETPKPTNPAVKLELVQSGRCEAVHTFTGNFNMKRATIEAKNFLDVLKQDDKIKVIGDWTAQGYNPPFALSFMKRNEIHVPVDPTAFPETEEALN